MSLSNEELKSILERKIALLENSHKEEKNISLDAVSSIIKTLGLSSDFIPLAQRYFQLHTPPSLIWLHLSECTGCSESLLRTSLPDFLDLIFDFISLEYHETFMSASGHQAEAHLEKILEKKDFILAVEGGVCAIDPFFLTIGAHGENGYEILKKCAKNAKTIFAMGTCSSYGGIQAAYPNPTKSVKISEVLEEKVINIPGCPPSDINIIAALCFYILFEQNPSLDEQNRPLALYGKCLHDLCERKAKFEAGNFAQSFDDENIKQGYCLFKVGCKGPYAYNNCPKVKFNSKTSWPVAAGHGCIACSEANFWDDFGFYEKPMNNEFSYNSFSTIMSEKNIHNASLDNLNSKNIILNLNDTTQILCQNETKFNFLDFSFEANPKIFLNTFAKTKMAMTLVQNYQEQFKTYYDFIQENYDDESKISNNILDLFYFIYPFTSGKKLSHLDEFLDLALAYKFKHPSKFDFKITINEQAKLDVSKSMRMPLIYLLGGLDKEAIAFGLVYSLKEHLKQALKACKNKYSKEQILICSNNEKILKLFWDLTSI
ncbi:hydrogenase small subunit [Campylobacter sp. RM16704]|uniref:hydrogenase small subunit n=1 Tax=Campylobacter sp. RM16704 TaxID=1500960 RepID=UPI00057F61DE|nr:hydrogenase small subunit [Campylobacter sp. RM16704]AJC85935.1 [NiFe] hydrogenase, small subunit [Campylobacter sp. RM16704]